MFQISSCLAKSKVDGVFLDELDIVLAVFPLAPGGVPPVPGGVLPFPDGGVPPVPAGAPAQHGVALVVLGAPLAEDGEAAVVHEDVLVRVLVLPHLLRRNAVIGGNFLKCVSSIEVN